MGFHSERVISADLGLRYRNDDEELMVRGYRDRRRYLAALMNAFQADYSKTSFIMSGAVSWDGSSGSALTITKSHILSATNPVSVAASQNCTDLLFDGADISLGGPGELMLMSLSNGILVSGLMAWNIQAFDVARGLYDMAVQYD
jgi:hypothetical protein